MAPKSDESKRLYTQYSDPATPVDSCDATEGVRNNEIRTYDTYLFKPGAYIKNQTFLVLYEEIENSNVV